MIEKRRTLWLKLQCYILDLDHLIDPIHGQNDQGNFLQQYQLFHQRYDSYFSVKR
jgi:hypothetical protein